MNEEVRHSEKWNGKERERRRDRRGNDGEN